MYVNVFTNLKLKTNMVIFNSYPATQITELVVCVRYDKALMTMIMSDANSDQCSTYFYFLFIIHNPTMLVHILHGVQKGFFFI